MARGSLSIPTAFHLIYSICSKCRFANTCKAKILKTWLNVRYREYPPLILII